MSQQCLDFLDHMQQEWEHWRVKTSIDKIQKEVEARTSYRRYASDSDGGRLSEEDDTLPAPDINTIFDPATDLAEYTLTLPPQSASEFEDSRYMLPLSVPKNPLLPAFVPGTIYPSARGNLPDVDDGRPVSIAGVSPHQPLRYEVQQFNKLRRLPDDFLDWLQAAEAQNHDDAHRLRSTTFLNKLQPPTRPGPHQSTSSTIVTPEKPSRNNASPHRTNSPAERSPVSPVFAHHALRMKADGRHSGSLERPIRLRQLSSRSNGSLHQGLSAMSTDNKSLPISQVPDTARAPSAPVGPDSPLRNRSATGHSAFGSLTQKFWSPRARRASDVSRDGYIDSSEEDEGSYQ